VVRDSIIWHDARIAGGARITRAVIDEEVEIGEKAVINSSQPDDKTIDDEMIRDEDIALIGRRRRIEPEAKIPSGARLKPAAED
jgi:glucose-1-phosphate adenylyltransferase